MLRKITFILAVSAVQFVLVSCSGEDGAGKTTGQATDDTVVSQSECSQGATRCNGTVVQHCVSAVWTDWTDCAIANERCAPDNGVAICYNPAMDTVDTGGDTATVIQGTDSATSQTAGTDDSATVVDDTVSDSDSGTDTAVDTASTDADTATDSGVDTQADSNTETAVLDTDTDSETASDSASETTDSETDTALGQLGEMCLGDTYCESGNCNGGKCCESGCGDDFCEACDAGGLCVMPAFDNRCPGDNECPVPDVCMVYPQGSEKSCESIGVCMEPTCEAEYAAVGIACGDATSQCSPKSPNIYCGEPWECNGQGKCVPETETCYTNCSIDEGFHCCVTADSSMATCISSIATCGDEETASMEIYCTSEADCNDENRSCYVLRSDLTLTNFETGCRSSSLVLTKGEFKICTSDDECDATQSCRYSGSAFPATLFKRCVATSAE